MMGREARPRAGNMTVAAVKKGLVGLVAFLALNLALALPPWGKVAVGILCAAAIVVIDTRETRRGLQTRTREWLCELRDLYVDWIRPKNYACVALALLAAWMVVPPLYGWVTRNANTINALAAAAAAAFTLVYVMLTLLLVQTTFRAYKSQTAPSIAIYLAPPEEYHDTRPVLVIHNVGNGVAYDVRFRLDLPAHPVKGHLRLERTAEMAEGLSPLVPGQKVLIHLTRGGAVSIGSLTKDRPYTFSITATWRDGGARDGEAAVREETFPIRLAGVGAGRDIGVNAPSVRIVRALERIAQPGARRDVGVGWRGHGLAPGG